MQSDDNFLTVFDAHKADWEILARIDPLWAILGDPVKKGNRWRLEEFFQTGFTEVEWVLERLDQLQLPRRRESLLDFGCGVGRLTRAFASHFRRCVGLDISEGMIRQAQVHNAHLPNCQFLVNDCPDLQVFTGNSFDMIYTNLVLQHLPSRHVIKQYLTEFVRVLRPQGLLVFQLPCFIPWIYRFMLRRRLYFLLRRLGFSDECLHLRLNLTNICMTYIPIRHVTSVLKDAEATVLDVVQIPTGSIESAAYYVSATYYVTKG
jgi:SAM-dependent methyltransferase